MEERRAGSDSALLGEGSGESVKRMTGSAASKRPSVRLVCAVALFAAVPAGGQQVDLVSLAATPASVPGGTAQAFDVSVDGRWMVFESRAIHMVPGQSDGNGAPDVFLHDRVAGTTILVSHAHGSPLTAAGAEGQGAVISADGRWIAFASPSGNLIAGQTAPPISFSIQVFLYDRVSGMMTLVSGSGGSPTTAGNNGSFGPQLTADGRYVTFVSWATDLVAGLTDSNGELDVYVYDRQADTTTLVSRSSGAVTVAGNGESFNPRISADGRYVGFVSRATDLVPGQTDGNSGDDIFLFDRVVGTTVLVSHASGSPTTAGNGSSGNAAPFLSADGRRVGFDSTATDLVPAQVDTPGTQDAFLFDQASGSILLLSYANGSLATAVGGLQAIVSGDGNWIAFSSAATNVVAGQVDSNGVNDIFLRDRAAGTTALVSHAAGAVTTAGDGFSGHYTMSDEGIWIGFHSLASNLVAGGTDGNAAEDVFLYERATGAISLASHAGASTTITANGRSINPQISGDGTRIGFLSLATDLAASPSDVNGDFDLFLAERATGGVAAVSLRAPGPPSVTAERPSIVESLSADGRYVVFKSDAGNLVPGQLQNGLNVFLHDRLSGLTTLVSRSAGSPTFPATGWDPVLSLDGRWVAFLSSSTSLVQGQTDSNGAGSDFLFCQGCDVFLFDRISGATTLVSHRSGSPTQTGDGSSASVSLSNDGRYVAFMSFASDLIPGPMGPKDLNVFLFDRLTGSTVLVSRSSASPSAGGNGSSFGSVVSDDGRSVAFTSTATNLVPGQMDTPESLDVFLWDRETQGVTLVSRSSASPQAPGNNSSFDPVISADGRFVAFVSQASDLVTGQVDGGVSLDIFLWDRVSGATTLVSRVSGSPTVAGSGLASDPTMSADGRFVAFGSSAIDLVSGQIDVNHVAQGFPVDIFLWDRLAGETVLVSRSVAGSTTTGNSGSFTPVVSRDGRFVAFSSGASDLLSAGADKNASRDVFVFDRLSGTTTLASRAAGSPTSSGNGDSGAVFGGTPRVNADGTVVAFDSQASDLVDGDENGTVDVFTFSRSVGTAFHTLPPCRLIDTREPGSGPALASGVTATLAVHGACGVPATAQAVALNVTITQPTGAGHLALHPGDVGAPDTSTINFSPGQTRSNNAIQRLALNGSGGLAVTPAVTGGGSVHVILDVVGYFEEVPTP